MKKSIQNDRRSSHLLRAGLFAATLALLTGAGVQSAQADIVARGRVGGADVRVRIGTPERVVVRTAPRPVYTDHCEAPTRSWYDDRLEVRWQALSRDDHRVAARLALLSGLPERHLLAERSHGMSWRRIARVHDIHPQLLAQARSHGPLKASYHSCSWDGHGKDHRKDHRKGGRRGHR